MAVHLNGCSAMLSCMGHGGAQRTPDRLDADFAVVIAETMQALATPSRVLILGRLSAGACSVNELSEAVGMEPSAVSHQLRLLRHLGLVIGSRDGRRVVYDLYDDHVGELQEQAISHVEHLRAGVARIVAGRTLAKA